jgi:hypothetical protein
MKIIGLQGLDDPQSIRAEVDRGARFVVYIYCVSVIVMTFKRTSDIHFVRAGQSAVVRGLPCTLVSFFFGWWGFPWGLVYTIEALIKNLGGGTDVTQAVLAQIDPPRAGAATRESETFAHAGNALPPPMPLRGDVPVGKAAASAPASSPVALGFFRLALLVIALGTVSWISVALYRGSRVPTALVNGLATPITLTLDENAPQTIAPNASVVITLSEGEHRFSWMRPDGRSEDASFTLQTAFWSRPLNRHVAVVNPDRTALVFHETTRYYPDDQPVPEGQNDYTLHAGRSFYLFPAADYFFESFPAQISLSRREVKTKTRYAHADTVAPMQRFFALSNKSQNDEARALAFRLGELYPDNEVLLRLALSQLPDNEIDAFFAAHLNDRPLRLEWHRAFQYHVEYKQPERDLRPRYRELAAQNPEDGAAAYLAARIERDPAARHALLRQSISAKHPCAYAHNSLAYEALTDARFPDALIHLRSAEVAGLDTLSFKGNQTDVLLANGLIDEALRELRAVRAKDTNPFSSTNRPYLNLELGIACRAHPEDADLMANLTKPYLDSVKAMLTPEEHTEVAVTFAALASYARGDEEGFTSRVSGMEDFRFAVAITRSQAADAAQALSALSEAKGSSWLLVYLAARETGDASVADQAYENALAAFAKESSEHRAVASLLRNGDADPSKICAELLSCYEKCVLATALGHRFPKHRETYHTLAAKLNFQPLFPSRFLARQLRPNTDPAMANVRL